MPSLYIASTGTFIGKSAVCMGLLKRMQRDGFVVGYMKPVSVSAIRAMEGTVDEDAALIRTNLDLDTPMEHMVPVAITPSVVDSILLGQTQSVSYEQTLRDAYTAVSRNRDVVVLEGSNHWAEGALVNLTADRVVELFNAPGLLVARYDSTRLVDTILTIQRYIGKHLIGVFINQIELPQLEFVKQRVAPFLESRNIAVFGLLPQDRILISVAVNDMIEHLGGQLIGKAEWCEKNIDSLMIGSMGSEAAISYLRRRANKAVITGGDRVDMQLVALETSTNMLILTGNLRPSQRVVYRAEEREVPILVVPYDTQTTVERAEELFGRMRFHQPDKIQRFLDLMDQHFDYDRLYAALELKK